jgi:hypothetical protein
VNVPTVAKNSPVGALYSSFQNGWTTDNLFIEWSLHFRQFAKASKDEPVLMIGTPFKK